MQSISYNPMQSLGLTSDYAKQNKEIQHEIVNGFDIAINNHNRTGNTTRDDLPVSETQKIDTSNLKKINLEQLTNNGFIDNAGFQKMQEISQNFVKESALTQGLIKIGLPNPIEPIGFMAGLQPIFHNEAEELAYQRQNMEDFLKLADAQEQLKKKFGEDVRIARDTVTGDYMMLRPGDSGYDSVSSTETAMANMKESVGMSRYNMSDFANVFRKFNFQL